MKGTIAKYLNSEITLGEAIKKHEGLRILIELIADNSNTHFNIRQLGKLSGLSPQISSIIKKLEHEGYITIYIPDNPHPKNNPPQIPLPNDKLLKLINETRL